MEELGGAITYRALDSASHNLALRLQSLGVVAGDHVCLLTRRGIALVVAMLAVLKCGAAYVPLDGQIVTDTVLEMVLEDAQPSLVLVSDESMRAPGQ